MDEDKLEKLYNSMISLLDNQQLDDIYTVMSNIIAETSYTHNVPIMKVLSQITATTLFTYGELINEEETSTKQ